MLLWLMIIIKKASFHLAVAPELYSRQSMDKSNNHDLDLCSSYANENYKIITSQLPKDFVPGYKNITCQFNLDLNSLENLFPLGAEVADEETWKCAIPKKFLCDQFSSCFDDECGCDGVAGNKTDVLFCPNRSDSCLAFPQICDGIHDCPGGIEECLCPDAIRLNCSSTMMCLPRQFYCDQMRHDYGFYSGCVLFEGNPEGVYEDEVDNPLSQCLEAGKHLLATSDDGDVAGFCKSNCLDYEGFDDSWLSFCDNIPILGTGGRFFSFACSEGDEQQLIDPLTKICDGKIDCENQRDELGCKGRFYCDVNYNDLVSMFSLVGK